MLMFMIDDPIGRDWPRLTLDADDFVCSNESFHFVSAPVSPANRRGCVQREGQGSRQRHDQGKS